MSGEKKVLYSKRTCSACGLCMSHSESNNNKLLKGAFFDHQPFRWKGNRDGGPVTFSLRYRVQNAQFQSEQGILTMHADHEIRCFCPSTSISQFLLAQNMFKVPLRPTWVITSHNWPHSEGCSTRFRPSEAKSRAIKLIDLPSSY